MKLRNASAKGSRYPLPPSKTCVACGREMEWRKKWAKNWDEVKYCSDQCRKMKKQPDLESRILDKLKERARDATICPSELLEGEQKQNKEAMEEVRRAARRLVEKDLIDIVQKGKVVDPNSFRGPIRLRLR